MEERNWKNPQRWSFPAHGLAELMWGTWESSAAPSHFYYGLAEMMWETWVPSTAPSHRHSKKNFKIDIFKKTLARQSNPEQKENCQNYHHPWFQVRLRTHNNKTTWCWHKADIKVNEIQQRIQNQPPIGTATWFLTKIPKKTTCWRKHSLLHTWSWENLISIGIRE